MGPFIALHAAIKFMGMTAEHKHVIITKAQKAQYGILVPAVVDGVAHSGWREDL